MSEVGGVLLVVLDSVRADAIDLTEGGATPNIAKLARRGTVFEKAIAPAGWTLPSHVSMFTGLSPTEHGVQAMPSAKEAMARARSRIAELVASGTFLPDWLSKRGVRTWLGSANVWVSKASGFDRFDEVVYRAFPPRKERTRGASAPSPTTNPRLPSWARRILPLRVKHTGKLIVERITSLRYVSPLARWALSRSDKGASHLISGFDRWLDSDPGSFFATMCWIETHDPHLAPKGHGPVDPIAVVQTIAGSGRMLARRMNRHNWGYREMSDRQISRLRRAYEAEVRYSDSCIGALLESLDSHGVLESTTVIVTADHGESFGENGLVGHGISLGEQLLNVPLIIAGPGVPKERVGAPVSLTSLASTIAALLADDPSPFPAPDLLKAEGRGRARAEFEAPGSYFHSAGMKMKEPEDKLKRPAAAFYSGTKKLVIGSFWDRALFDLGTDAGEERNLAGETDVPHEIEEMLAAWRQRTDGKQQ